MKVFFLYQDELNKLNADVKSRKISQADWNIRREEIKFIKIRQNSKMPKINRIPEEHKMISAGLLPAAQKFLSMQELKNKGLS